MNGFANLLDPLPEYQKLKAALSSGNTPAMAVGLSHIHKAQFIFSLCRQLGKQALVITPDEGAAWRFCEDLNALFGEEAAYLYPSRDFTFREVEGVSREYEHARLKVLGLMASGHCPVVVGSAEAVSQHTIPLHELAAHTTVLKTGDSWPLHKLAEVLLAAGYERTEQVEGVCQFTIRGGIADFFPPHSPDPYRIEFWGDEIDTISTFKTETQRRVDTVKSVVITPAREALPPSAAEFCTILEDAGAKLAGKQAAAAKEKLKADIEKLRGGLTLASIDRFLPLLYPEGATVFDYCNDRLVFVCDAADCRETLKNASWQTDEDVKMLFEEGLLFKGCDHFYDDFTEITRRFCQLPTLILETFTRSAGEIPLKILTDIQAVQLSTWGGETALLKDDLRDYRTRGFGTVVFAGTKRACMALVDDLHAAHLDAVYREDVSEVPPGAIYVVDNTLSGGFEYPSIKLALITHAKTTPKKQKKKRKVKKGDQIKSISDLTVGDYVVHISHGIGVFDGIVKREIQGVVKDYLKIRYAGSDTLFVPVTQLDLVSKYIGAKSESGVRLSKLNSVEWQKTRQRVKKAVAEMATELIALYSQRMQVKGYAFAPDSDWQREFEERFPYEETDDQLRCVEEIKGDMQSTHPMDRLLCGDVGFGKTEVALRAVFKAVLDSKQVAVLVPTTILAWQHYQTFRKRLEGYPITVELLSRFRTPKQQAQIVKDVKAGRVDIVIGTHRVLQKDVEFKDLGLCVIDEEQRFGVAHKERFKEMRKNVDVLTLSATPIPRTLNMAMSGIRDMSVIEEAPQDRYPVQTYVLEHDWGVLAEAMRKELRRGGQVFYLHNRVESIDSCAARIQQLLPDARILTAHGKMGEDQLSRVWRQLMDHEIDILVCTTIIETGVDVANCNTLIIEDADKMGLSQLYQLRGRVGRSTRRAFAYFTFTRGKALTDIASKRLAAIREFTSFGSGFRIAMRDLEIRGAGNILGAQQHGHMEAVGYDMYLRLLGEAVSEQKGEPVKQAEECTVDIQVDAHIPEKYIVNLSQRIDIYKKIAAITDEEDAMDVIDELIDRFGDPPAAVKGLVDVALVRGTAAAMGIAEISQQEDRILLYPQRLDLEKAAGLASRMKGRVLVNAGDRPYLCVKMLKGQKPVDLIRETLKAMQECS